MYRHILALALVALVAANIMGQATSSDTPYVGTLTGDNVYVRATPGDGYPCTKLSKGAQINVVGEQEGWLKILPPRDCFSLISKKYVQAEGKVGTVTGNNVLVRAGSKLYPNRIERVQGRMDVGDKVGILGQLGDYYKIIPPPGTHLWVSGRYVAGADGVVRVATTRTVGPATGGDPVPTTQRVIISRNPATSVSRDVAGFDAAEEALADEFKKPRERRDLAGLLKRYEALESEGGALLPFVQARVKFIQSEIDLAADLKEVEIIMAGSRTIATTTTTTTTSRRQRSYAAEGLLAPSGLFRGGPTGPKRWTISDPETRVIYAYIQCTNGAVDLSRHVGAYVGVVGKPTFDEKLRTYIVEAEQVILLPPGGAAGGPTPDPAVPPRPIAPEPAEPKVIPPPPPTEPKVVAPVPTEPKVVAPVPVEPKVVTPTPTEPKVVAPVPVEPKTVTPAPVEPKVVDPVPVEPNVVPPTPIEPKAVTPVPVEPKVAPLPVEPKTITPIPVEPKTVTPGPVGPDTIPPPVVPKTVTPKVIDPSKLPEPKPYPTTMPVVRVPTTMPATTVPVPKTGLPVADPDKPVTVDPSDYE